MKTKHNLRIEKIDRGFVYAVSFKTNYDTYGFTASTIHNDFRSMREIVKLKHAIIKEADENKKI